jgi:hypothetical protein
MRRRTLLATTASALALAGCVSAPGAGNPSDRSPSADSPSPSSDPSADESPTPTPTIADHSLSPRKACETPGTADVVFDASTVTVTGCIRGPNGCHVPVLDSVAYDADADRLTVVVATESTADDDTACTQAIVERGYEVTVRFEDGLPHRAVVYHEGVDDRVEAARVLRTES